MKIEPRSKSDPTLYVHFKDAQGNRRRISTKTTDPSLAQLKALEIMREHLVDALPEEDRRKHGNLETLAGMLRRALHEQWRGQKSHREKRLLVGKIAREIGHWPRGAITYQRLKDYLDTTMTRLGEPLSPATKNRYVSCIHTACTLARRDDPSFILPEFPHYAENNVKERYMSHDEERRVLEWFELNTAPKDRQRIYLRHLMVLLLDTGMRASEALKEMTEDSLLRGRDGVATAVHLTHGNTKSGKGRVVPLTERARAAAEWLVASPLHGQWTSNNAGRAWKFVVEKCGIEGVTLHTLRHTCASRMVQEETDLYLVSTWLGHSSMEVTRRYAHLNPASLRRGLAAIERATAPRTVPEPDGNSAREAHPLTDGTNIVAFPRKIK